MRKALKLSVAIAVAYSVHLTAGAAASGSVVFDPTNLVQNLATAQNTVNTYRTQVQSLITQYQQYQNMVKQAQSLGTSMSIKSIGSMLTQGDVAGLQRSLAAANDLTLNVGSVQKSFTARLDEARLAGGSWTKYLELEKVRLGRREDAAVARVNSEQQAMKRIESDYSFIREEGAKIGGSTGLHESMQQMNLQMNRMLQMNAEIMRQSALAQGSQDAEKKTQENEDQARKIRTEEIAQSARDAAAAARSSDKDDAQNFFSKTK